MTTMNSATRLKLLMPILYCLITNVLFNYLFSRSGNANEIAGWVITDIGFALWLTARVQLGNAFSIAPKSKYLVKSGLYSKLRHPVYYFSILAVVGISIFLWNVFALLVVAALIALEIFRIQKEEALLQQTFGKEYTRYKQDSWF